MPKHYIDNFDQLFRRTVRETSDGSATVRLKLDRIRARQLRCLTHVTVENESSGYTLCRLGIDANGVDHYLDELTTIAADELAVSRGDIILGEGDVFFAELTGTTPEDMLVMTCIGWEQAL